MTVLAGQQECQKYEMYFTDTDEIEQKLSDQTKPNPEPSEMGELFVLLLTA